MTASVAIGAAYVSFNGRLSDSDRLLAATAQERDQAIRQVQALQLQIECSRTKLADYLQVYGTDIINGDVAGIIADTDIYREAVRSCATKA